MIAAGSLIAGRYRLLRRLGAGGMGVVWAAKNESIGRDVAIKVLRPEFAHDPDALQRFFNEARICGSIRHPGIVDVLDLGDDDDSPFIVMELLEGESLDERLDRERRLPPSVILPMVRDLARSLALAHQRGIVHRDLKPANVFLHRSPTGELVVKVLDFGISKILSSSESSTKTTQKGTVVGSPAYMSPEHALGRAKVDGRTDVYALGVILYEAFSGRLPYEEETYNALIVEIATNDPPDLALLAPDLPEPIVALVRATMVKNRDARIATMEELAARIDSLLPLAKEADRVAPVGLDPGDVATVTGKTSPSTQTSHTMNAGSKPGGERGSDRRVLVGVALGLCIGLGGVITGVVLLNRPEPASGTAPEAASAELSATAPIIAPTVTPAVVTPAESAAPAVVTPVESAAPAPAASSAASRPAPSATAGQGTPRPSATPGASRPTKKPNPWGYD